MDARKSTKLVRELIVSGVSMESMVIETNACVEIKNGDNSYILNFVHGTNEKGLLYEEIVFRDEDLLEVLLRAKELAAFFNIPLRYVGLSSLDEKRINEIEHNSAINWNGLHTLILKTKVYDKPILSTNAYAKLISSYEVIGTRCYALYPHLLFEAKVKLFNDSCVYVSMSISNFELLDLKDVVAREFDYWIYDLPVSDVDSECPDIYGVTLDERLETSILVEVAQMWNKNPIFLDLNKTFE